MKHVKQAGFSAVELLITLFVAAGFLLAAYQLYNVIIRDGGATNQRALASNAAYEYLRQYEASAPSTCAASTPHQNSTITIEGIASATLTVQYTCPVPGNTSVAKVEVTVQYGDDESVSFATYTHSNN